MEKPDIETARNYLEAGTFYWNSGMFVWSVKSFEAALRDHAPELMSMAERMMSVAGTPTFDAILEEEYGKIEKISVDYAIMEKSSNIAMARGTFEWDDVGSWPALENHFEKDDAGNVCIGKVETLDAANNVVVSEDRLTAVIGLDNVVVVQAGAATLVCAKDRAQDVKAMVKQLAARGGYDDVL